MKPELSPINGCVLVEGAKSQRGRWRSETVVEPRAVWTLRAMPWAFAVAESS
jgi:hypothetical protein